MILTSWETHAVHLAELILTKQRTESLENAAVWEIKRRDKDHYSVRNMTTNRYLVCNGKAFCSIIRRNPMSSPLIMTGELRGTTHVWHETGFPSDNKWQFIVKSTKDAGCYRFVFWQSPSSGNFS